MRTSNRATATLLFLIGAVLASERAWAQIDFSGEWAARLHEDQLHRNDVLPGGLAVGDYTGLPINDAARLKADSWDASILSARERQTIPGPSVYGGRAASVRISKIVDDDTQALIGFKIYRSPGNNGTFRMIWMDGRPHPPEYAAHTWQGFSTAAWQGDMLTVETTHIKMGWIQRNGVPSSDRATLTEHFVRHGDYLTIISVVYDPVYLEEPFIRSTNYVLDLAQELAPIHGEIVDEIAGRPDGYVPHHLPGSNIDQLREFATHLGIPFEATRGGRDSTYPEYQLRLQQPDRDDRRRAERQEPPKLSAKAGAGKATKIKYVPPRTPWGDPDLQGNFTNKYEGNTPLERPEEFAGRRVQDVTSAELAELLEKRQQQFIGRPAAVGPLQFRDPLEVTKGSRAWFLVDPPDGKIPAMTPTALQRLGPADSSLDTTLGGIINSRKRTGGSFGDGPFDGPEDFGLWDRCITRGLPGSMLPHILGNSYQIVQTPGFVAIRYELVHDTRVIPLDGRPHLGKGLQLEMGDARGHWDGNTLIVETTNFKDRSTYRNANAATLRLVERFTRTAADRIEWAVTVDDPTTWMRPWTFSMPLTMNDEEAVLEFACHEGNYAVPHILSGARATEKAN